MKKELTLEEQFEEYWNRIYKNKNCGKCNDYMSEEVVINNCFVCKIYNHIKWLEKRVSKKITDKDICKICREMFTIICDYPIEKCEEIKFVKAVLKKAGI